MLAPLAFATRPTLLYGNEQALKQTLKAGENCVYVLSNNETNRDVPSLKIGVSGTN